MRLLFILVAAGLLLCGLAVVLAFTWFRNDHVAFLGDSLTQGWYLPENNFGVYGQTTAQIMLRRPWNFKTVYILAGTNDVELHIPTSTTMANLETMAVEYKSRGFCPILGTIPPIHAEHDNLMPAVINLNSKIQSLGTRLGIPVVDYFDMLKDHPNAQSDGVHMKRSGYLYMDLALLKLRAAHSPDC